MDPNAWAIDQAAVDAEVARMLAYAATSGAEGVVTPGDLKVQATSVASSSIRVAPGGAILLNRYGGGAGQSYAVRNGAEGVWPLSPVVGRTDLIVARLTDPQYTGQVPPDRLNYQYVSVEAIQGVPAGTASARELNLGYPAIALARITPTSTNITNAMITDLRRVALPRSAREMRTVYSTGTVAGGTAHEIPKSSYQSWPIRSTERPSFYVPEWATRVDIVAHMSGIVYHGGGESAAGIRSGFGSDAAQNGIIVESAGTGTRRHYTAAGSHDVPSYRRGSDQLINLQALRSSGTGSWYADYQTTITIDVQFREVAV